MENNKYFKLACDALDIFNMESMVFTIETYLNSLPPLNENLKNLYCSYNELTSLPSLNKKLKKKLYCDRNPLTLFPPLNNELKYLLWKTYLIYDLLILIIDFELEIQIEHDDCELDIIENDFKEQLNEILNIINKFRHLYYSLKFKKNFIKWLWKSREKQIMEKYHPNHLLENLDENTDLDEFLNNW